MNDVLRKELEGIDKLREFLTNKEKMTGVKIIKPVTVEEPPQDSQEDFAVFFPPNGGRQILNSGASIKFDFYDGKVSVYGYTGNIPNNLSKSLQLTGKNAIYSIRISTKNQAINVRVNNGGVRTAYSGEFKIRGIPIREIELFSPYNVELEFSLIASTNPDADFSGGVRFQDSFIEDNDFLKVAPYHELIAKGSVSGHVANQTIGNSNGNISTTSFGILSNITATQPSRDTAMKIVSDSANDSAGGTGAQQVTIEYFNSEWGTKKKEVVTLNGTTAVNLVDTKVYRIDRMYVNRVGSLDTSSGNISLYDVATGTIKYAQIDSGTSFFERALHYLENGKVCVIVGAEISSSTVGGVLWRIIMSQEDSNRNLVPRASYSGQLGANSISISLVLPLSVSNQNNKRIAIGFAVKGLTSNQSCTGTLRFYEEDI